MDIKNELKSIIAKKASTLKQVCIDMKNKNSLTISPNNLTNKLRRNTIKFKEVESILDVLGYHIEFIENEKK